MSDLDAIYRGYRQRGYGLIEHFLTASELASVTRTADQLLAEDPDDGGEKFHQIGRGAQRRFLRQRHEQFPELERLLFSDKMHRLCQRLLRTDPHLFNEQFVVKGGATGTDHAASSFAWHQDGAYVGFDHETYLTIWIALDDVTTENGCVYVLPKNLDQDESLNEHVFMPDGQEKLGYTGDDPGIAVECKAGSALVFSSATLHRSGANRTSSMRRAYLAQYTSGAIIDPATNKPKHFAKPMTNGAT